MAQPSVAREPSMEEILASIRQIIESNEPGAGKAISASLPPVYGADEDENGSEIHLTVDDTYAGVEFPEPAMRSSDPRFVAANSAGTAPEAEVPARALSLADVAARVRAASERSAVQAGQALREIPSGFRQPEPQPAIMPEPPRAAAPQPTQPVFPPATVAPVPQAVIEQPAEPVFAEPPRIQVAASAPSVAEPTVVETALPPLEPAQSSTEAFLPSLMDEVQPTLLSENAGLQISRSFEELAAAIDGAERRSLDEIAEDMLRPMLREWLDDNLPTLVERLVREEIERVARGPRR
ncbi:conserved hypothetical protein [Rhizobium leguminosarum bv. trifolii WSM2304]|uniref:DUF2497 domain-containing protein n=1 Tax=Rhizobium leguminosarum bv. trifolii (strain WSM2304) TaxID=395492 RepID=A0ABF7QL42_RHILW|nr:MULTISPECIES: DUF2497 domain-containing protein [Rhizobium]ACI54766.1 conserved hypothetical protein [Rhizobium leguminosarum bv. trifolii WSM2304]